MDLRSRLRQAAELFVELPPDEPGAPKSTIVPASGNTEEDELDRRLRDQQRAFESLSNGGSASSAPTPKTVEQIVRESDGPNLGDIKVAPELGTSPPFRQDGALDFAAIYNQAALPAAPFSAEQTLSMLHALPADLPLSVRRQTVGVAIDAMGRSIGATPETIVSDASRKLAALSSFAENVEKHASEFASAAEFEIQLLTAQIEEKRKGVTAAQEKASAVQAQCHAEADRLDEVLKFFSAG